MSKKFATKVCHLTFEQREMITNCFRIYRIFLDGHFLFPNRKYKVKNSGHAVLSWSNSHLLSKNVDLSNQYDINYLRCKNILRFRPSFYRRFESIPIGSKRLSVDRYFYESSHYFIYLITSLIGLENRRGSCESKIFFSARWISPYSYDIIMLRISRELEV